jgi:glycine cleavage system aminomethyltransferase T
VVQTCSTLPFQARIRKSAFFNASLRYGCKAFRVYNRSHTAAGFSAPLTEYHDLLNGVVLWPVAGKRQVEIAGPDAERFVEWLTPRDLHQQKVGPCKYVLVTAPRCESGNRPGANGLRGAGS